MTNIAVREVAIDSSNIDHRRLHSASLGVIERLIIPLTETAGFSALHISHLGSLHNPQWSGDMLMLLLLLFRVDMVVGLLLHSPLKVPIVHIPEKLNAKLMERNVVELKPLHSPISNHEALKELATKYDFDNTIVFDKNSIFSTGSLIPKDALETIALDFLVEDMALLIDSMSHLATRGDDKVAARLAIVKGQRCPLWHVDSVNVRLIKTYYGKGT